MCRDRETIDLVDLNDTVHLKGSEGLCHSHANIKRLDVRERLHRGLRSRNGVVMDALDASVNALLPKRVF